MGSPARSVLTSFLGESEDGLKRQQEAAIGERVEQNVGSQGDALAIVMGNGGRGRSRHGALLRYGCR